jgi:hypothetical protein
MWVEQVRAGAFSWTPTPAIIAPIEYTMLLKDYEEMGGHVEAALSQRRMKEIKDVQP